MLVELRDEAERHTREALQEDLEVAVHGILAAVVPSCLVVVESLTSALLLLLARNVPKEQ
jgi:hypothetical protein